MLPVHRFSAAVKAVRRSGPCRRPTRYPANRPAEHGERRMTKAKRKTLPKNFEALLAEGDHAKITEALTACQPDAHGGFNRTALAFAGCSDELSRWLVANGANLEAEGAWGDTPLQHRITYGGSIDVLLERWRPRTWRRRARSCGGGRPTRRRRSSCGRRCAGCSGTRNRWRWRRRATRGETGEARSSSTRAAVLSSPRFDETIATHSATSIRRTPSCRSVTAAKYRAHVDDCEERDDFDAVIRTRDCELICQMFSEY